MKKSVAAASALTVALLYGLLALIAVILGVFFDFPVWGSLLAGVFVVILQFLINPWLTDLNYRWFYRTDFDWAAPDYLRSFIEKVCEENHMNYPKLGLIDDGAPNAFTYGRTKNSARIVLTRGDFELLSEDEVKAVVGHELGHAAHNDMLVMTVVQLVPLLLHAIADVCLKTDTSGSPSRHASSKLGDSGSSGSSGNSKAEDYVAVVGVIALIFYAICELIILHFSRTREYYADDFSVETTGDPSSLCSALVNIGLGLSTHRGEKLKKQTSVTMQNSLGIADAGLSSEMAICGMKEDGTFSRQGIIDAMKWDLWSKWARFYEILSTHPLTSKRILAISKRCSEFGQAPFIEFNEKPDQSYADEFARDVLIMCLPWLFFCAGLIACIITAAGDNDGMFMASIGGTFLACGLSSLFKLNYSHKLNRFERTTVENLIKIVDVSGVKTVPCELEGTLIGRGDPGCIFNEDFVIRDKTGILFVNYRQPLSVMDKFFALFRSPDYLERVVTLRGWYMRTPVPVLEIYEMTKDGETRRIRTLKVKKILRIVLIVIGVAAIVLTMLGFCA